ncbi:MAG: hypothetical protein MMC33_008103 [Icmadophila ericetorum]|nr:hypothetical protein [Icmadophila ericetorum]
MGGSKRKPPARAAKKDPWADEEHLFSVKSRLTQIDLHKYFLIPEAWNILTEEEKGQIRSLLPPHITPNEDGALPQEFLKYDMDWRNALRLFQVELEAGHYEEEWLREASEAMEERAAGKFDKWKEEHFEEFWGQKQKLAPNAVAGNMANLKLDVLIKAGVFKVGDVWRFTRNFKRDKGKVLLEKDATIISMKDVSLTFAIPPGQHRYLSSIGIQDLSQLQKYVDAATSPEEKGQEKEVDLEACTSGTAGEAMNTQKDAAATIKIQSSTTAPAKTPKPRPTAEEVEEAEDEQEDPSLSTPCHSSHRTAKRQKLTNGTAAAVKRKETPSPDALAALTLSLSQSRDPIIFTIQAPHRLEHKIIEIDGRIENPPNRNAWKTIRVRREEQDLGSLWEVREEFWVRNGGE